MELVWNGNAELDVNGEKVSFNGLIQALLNFLSFIFDKYLPAEIK